MQFIDKYKSFIKGISNEERAIKGDKEAFVQLINENKISLYRVSKGILKKDEKIEDAVQSTILKAYEKIYTLKKKEYFKTWLIRILINECNEILRKEKKVIPLDEDIIKNGYEDKYENVDLARAIASLEEDLKIVTILYYYEDLPQREIAGILKINECTIRTRLLRSRKKLYNLLQEGEGGNYDGL